MAKARAERLSKEEVTERIEILYEVGLSIQVGVDGQVPALSERDRRQVLLENVLQWLESASGGGVKVADFQAAARELLRNAEEMYEGEEILDVTISA